MNNLITILICVVSSFILYFLVQIARFYRLKSGIGIKHKYYFFSSIVFILGLLLSIDGLPSVLNIFSSIMIITGGIGLVILSIALYKSMMSVNKDMG